MEIQFLWISTFRFVRPASAIAILLDLGHKAADSASMGKERPAAQGDPGARLVQCGLFPDHR